MRHASWDLRDVCDLPPICLKGSIYRSVLPRKTVARIRYWLLTKLLTYSVDQLTNASCVFKCDVTVTVAVTVELSV